MNGAPLSPIGDWVIAISNGKDLIGKPAYARAPLSVAGRTAPVGRIERLAPVFELQIKIELLPIVDPQTRRQMADAQGNPMFQQRANYAAVPVLLLHSIHEVELPDDAIIIEVASLSSEDRKRVAACVAQADQMQASMRSAETGLSLVSSLPAGLPKPPGLLP